MNTSAFSFPDLLVQQLTHQGIAEQSAEWVALGLALSALLLLAWSVHLVLRKVLLKGLGQLVRNTAVDWDDILFEEKVFLHLLRLLPYALAYALRVAFLGAEAWILPGVTVLLQLLLLLQSVLLLNALLSSVLRLYQRTALARRIPGTSFVQVLKLLLYFFGAILALALLLNKSPLYLISGLGALTAVLLLVFKDTVMGFVAGVQLIANRMVMPGDWIEMPKYGADGDVLEVALTTVKVQNWDKTITTIPTYALISDSFKNWRGMSESGGRRIKRSLRLDLQSVRFCDEALLDRLQSLPLLSEYLKAKREDVVRRPDPSRALTNLGTFRAYALAYLRAHPMIRQDMTLLVRQLAPGEHGVPLEIYAFCSDTAWANYEGVMADIFDHLFAMVPEFQLRLYQRDLPQLA